MKTTKPLTATLLPSLLLSWCCAPSSARGSGVGTAASTNDGASDGASDGTSDAAATNSESQRSNFWGPANLNNLASLLFPTESKHEKKYPTGPPLSSSSSSRTESFVFQEGVNYELLTDIVDGEFCDPTSPLSVSGYFGVEGSRYDSKQNSKQYFFWMFEKRSNFQNDYSNNESGDRQQDGVNEDDKREEASIPFVIWLNGGPGCSSLLGLVTENGPCLVNPDGESTTPNPNSWTEVAHVLWLDQPAGVGYSYGEESDFEEEMIAEDTYYFLQSFFRSEVGKKYGGLPLFITGESYAGKYIPAIGTRIWEANNLPNIDDDDDDDDNNNLLHLNLAGLAIGNGWIDPKTQYQHYAEMAIHNSHNLKLVDDDTYQTMKAAEPNCTSYSRKCYKGNNLINECYCEESNEYCTDAFLGPIIDRGICVYNIQKDDTCDDDTIITKYLNLETTKQALHVASDKIWQACNFEVNERFTVDGEKNAAQQISKLLNHDIPVLLYAGDLDYICNYLGVKATALNLKWKRADEFQNLEDRDWNNGAGLVRRFENNDVGENDGRFGGLLTFLQVFDAGHMVPTDQPEHSLVMIRQFLNGEPLV